MPQKTHLVKKTYVLIHGAFHGGWCWRDVAQLLRAEGHRVFTPTNSGLAERAHLLSQQPTLDTHIDEIIELIIGEKLDDVILVGHSLGGCIAGGVTDRAKEKIRHLVLLDAHILRNGTAVTDVAPSEVLEYYQRVRVKNGGNGAIPVPPADFFGVTDSQQIAWLEQNLTPQPVETFFSPLRLHHPLGAGRPVTYITCTDPYFRHTKAAREFAHGIVEWQQREIATGHDAMVSAPAEVAALLMAID